MKVFVLGAADPEMEEIEAVLRQHKYEVRYAMYRSVRMVGDTMQYCARVRADNAYDADELNEPLPAGAEVIFVECEVRGLTYVDLVDHHRLGDPGYGKEPAQYFEGSSLGQVLTMLQLEPTPLQRVIAAADHCPTQAYKGLCPGVDVALLRTWRTQSRATRRGITPEEMEQAIERGHQTLLNAEKVPLAGELIAWVEGRDSEIPEASARYGVPFMYAEHHRPGVMKLGIMGAKPEVIATWMRDCGLSNVYGDPTRGYAGGYCPA